MIFSQEFRLVSFECVNHGRVCLLWLKILVVWEWVLVATEPSVLVSEAPCNECGADTGVIEAGFQLVRVDLGLDFELAL